MSIVVRIVECDATLKTINVRMENISNNVDRTIKCLKIYLEEKQNLPIDEQHIFLDRGEIKLPDDTKLSAGQKLIVFRYPKKTFLHVVPRLRGEEKRNVLLRMLNPTSAEAARTNFKGIGNDNFCVERLERAEEHFWNLEVKLWIDDFRDALGMARRKNNPKKTCLCMILMGRLLLVLGKYKCADKFITKAQEINDSKCLGLDFEIALIQARVKLKTENFEKVLEIIDQVCKKCRDSRALAEIAEIRGLVSHEQGELEKAEAYFAEARDKLVDNVRELALDVYASRILSSKEKYDESLEKLKECRNEFKKLKNEYWVMLTDLEISENHYRIGDYGLSANILKDLLKKMGMKEFECPYFRSRIFLLLGNIRFNEGRFEISKKFLLQSFIAVQSHGALKSSIAIYVNFCLGTVHGKLGDFEESMKKFEKSRKIAEEIGLCTIQFRAKLYYRQGFVWENTDPTKAQNYYLKCLEQISKKVENKEMKEIALNAVGNLAVVLQKTGHLEKSIEKYGEIDKLYFDLMENFAKTESRECFRERYKKIFDYIIFAYIKAKMFEKIVRVIEISKSISDYFAWKKWHERIRKDRKKDFELIGNDDWSLEKVYEKNPVDKTVLIFFTYGGNRLIRLILRREEWLFSDWKDFNSMKLVDLLKVYSKKIDVGFKIYGKKNQIEWNYPTNTVKVEETFKKLREANAELYDLLIEGIEDFLPQDPNEHFVIVPHGPIFNVPFNSLFDEKEGKYFIEKYTFSMSPSLFLYQVNKHQYWVGQKYRERDMREKVPGLLLGDPANAKGNTRILGNTLEVEKIGEICEKFDFRDFRRKKTPNAPTKKTIDVLKRVKRKVKSETPKKKTKSVHLCKNALNLKNFANALDNYLPLFLYFGMHCNYSAFHTGSTFPPIFDVVEPEVVPHPHYCKTGSIGFSENESLHALDIEKMNLEGIEFVFLNCCNTLKGRTTKEGDILGLRRSFFLAGVPYVIGFDTPLHNDVGFFVSQKFFENQMQRKFSKTLSLRKAILEMIGLKDVGKLAGKLKIRDLSSLWGGYQAHGYEPMFCGSCGPSDEDLSTDSPYFQMPGCGHTFCRGILFLCLNFTSKDDCFVQFCKDKIREGEISFNPKSGFVTITCPVDGCDNSPEDVHFFQFLEKEKLEHPVEGCQNFYSLLKLKGLKKKFEQILDPSRFT